MTTEQRVQNIVAQLTRLTSLGGDHALEAVTALDPTLEEIDAARAEVLYRYEMSKNSIADELLQEAATRPADAPWLPPGVEQNLRDSPGERRDKHLEVLDRLEALKRRDHVE